MKIILKKKKDIRKEDCDIFHSSLFGLAGIFGGGIFGGGGSDIKPTHVLIIGGDATSIETKIVDGGNATSKDLLKYYSGNANTDY